MSVVNPGGGGGGGGGEGGIPPPPAKPVIKKFMTSYGTHDDINGGNDPSNSGRWSDCYKCPSPQDIVKYSNLYIQLTWL